MSRICAWGWRAAAVLDAALTWIVEAVTRFLDDFQRGLYAGLDELFGPW